MAAAIAHSFALNPLPSTSTLTSNTKGVYLGLRSPKPFRNVKPVKISFSTPTGPIGGGPPAIRCHAFDFNTDVIYGGRESKGIMVHTFRKQGIKQIGVLVKSDEGLAWAMQLRHCLQEENSDIAVKIAFQNDSIVLDVLNWLVHTEFTSTLGTVQDIASNSDLFLFPDDTSEENDYVNVFKHIKPHSLVGLFSSFHLKRLKTMDLFLPKNVGVLFLNPMKKEPHAKSSQVTDISTCRIAVYQDLHDNVAADVAIGLAVALGSPITFCTTLDCINDIPINRRSNKKRNNDKDFRLPLDDPWSPSTIIGLLSMFSSTLICLSIIYRTPSSNPLFGKIAAALSALSFRRKYTPDIKLVGSIMYWLKMVGDATLQVVLKSDLLMPLLVYLVKAKSKKSFEVWKALLHSFTTAKAKGRYQSSDNTEPTSADSSSRNPAVFGSFFSILTVNLLK